jgi:hypothetical protein
MGIGVAQFGWVETGSVAICEIGVRTGRQMGTKWCNGVAYWLCLQSMIGDRFKDALFPVLFLWPLPSANTHCRNGY